MFQKIKRFIDKYGMIKKKEKILVCLSGGPDSLFLAHFLLKYKKLYALKIYACHIDHCYRDSSYRDADFCRDFCRIAGIPFYCRKIHLDKFSEEKARKLRYEIFSDLARKLRCDKIATGHTLDDNAETVIMWLIRGCGIKGLLGIPPVRGNIIRPVLCVSKNEITNYLREKEISFCVDETNLREDFTRNKIRHRIIPEMCSINPKVREHLFSFSELWRNCDIDTFNKIKYNKKKIFNFILKEKTVYFDADKLDAASLSVRRIKSGDRMVPFGMSEKKKIQDIFVDDKVPRNIRHLIPVVVCGKKIIWLAGIRRSSDAKITGKTKNVLRMRYDRILPGSANLSECSG